MSYRGADLDLRTAGAWSAGSSGTIGQEDLSSDAGGPLWVDETLLDCANYAYDLALAHRAREVRLEHLVHAFSRIDAAAGELEGRGVRVPALRRDSAVVIASDIPAGLPDTDTPQRSHDLEDVLRRASDHTMHAGRPAGVGDVVQVLLDMRSDVPASALLLRHLPRGGRELWSGPAPAPARPVASMPRSRLADRDGERAHGGTPMQLTRPAQRPDVRRPSELTLVQGLLDRLAEIERAMSDRFEAVEIALANSAPQPIDLEAVTKRFDAIDTALRAPSQSGFVEMPSEITDRLAALERSLAEERAERIEALSSLASDVKTLVNALGASHDGASNQPSLADRMELLGEEFEQHRDALSSHVKDRLSVIERLLSEQSDKFSAELAEVGDSVTKLNVNQQLLAGSIDQWRSNDAGEMHLINSRIGAIQEDGTKRLQMLERLATDIEALAQSSPTPPSLPASVTLPKVKSELTRSFRQWLLGTEDWIRASWQRRPWF
jgi:hypothetical protein